MTELKTLKDIKSLDLGNCVVISKKVLRAEAIKWIKKDRELPEDYNLNSLSQRGLLFLLIERWKNRFNITEEDLKGEQTK